MAVGEAPGARVSALPTRYCWLLLLLTPLLAGGAVVGDEALLLTLVHGFDASGLTFADYAREPGGWYIFHHTLWYGILYATTHVVDLLHASPLLVEAIVSCETVAAALAGIALCYVFLVRRLQLGPTRSAATVLVYFAGGYGVYTFCMGGQAESYMVLIMAARLFFVEPGIVNSKSQGWKLAVADSLLVAFKAYSVLFVVLTLPLFWGRASRTERLRYLGVLGILMLLLAAVKIWIWNPPTAYLGLGFSNTPQIFLNLAEEIGSPWTGLPFCLPALFVLFWSPKTLRKDLAIKVVGLLGCMAFFSRYAFFDGNTPGGRYIFPFTVSLLPELAAAISVLFSRHPRTSWLIPVVIVLFLPVCIFGFPFFSRHAFPARGPCQQVHPVLYSWKVAIAKISHQSNIQICYYGENFVLPARDVASPRLGPWRVAYLLEGGHSAYYREATHDQVQRQHDLWGTELSQRLASMGLGNPYLWRGLGLIPAILAFWLSIWVALRINTSDRPMPQVR